MSSSCNSMKHLTLEEIKNVIDSFGDFAESTLHAHSLVLIINKSGAATFTSCGWKLLSEADCSCPVRKLISNAAKNYTSLCGDDCKYFLFILKEVFNVIYNRVNGTELYMRKELIYEIHSVKHILPCLFKSVQNMSGGYLSVLKPVSFPKDLRSVVLTFMSSRFSTSVSEILSSLICTFIQHICEMKSLKTILDYVISHFDILCCKIQSPLSESRVLKGFLFYTKHIPLNVNLENVNFVVVWDLAMKLVSEDVTWVIKDQSFITQLNPMQVYKKCFDYFKSQGIKCIFTPSTCDKNLKLLCKNINVFLFDQLEMEEIKHMLSCFQLCPLENLNEILESKHIGKLNYVKSLSINKACFLHLSCTNSARLLNAHHILLSAPCNAVWQEYYSECLNCFKLILQWLSSKTDVCLQNRIIKEVPERNKVEATQLLSYEETEDCDVCSNIKLKFQNEHEKFACLDVVKSGVDGGMLLPPCFWELIFKIILEKVSEDSTRPCNIVLQAVHLAIVKSICKRIGIPFIAVKNVENTCTDFIKKCKLGEVKFLEPVVCKEIMMNSILDLILQLLKIDSIVFVK